MAKDYRSCPVGYEIYMVWTRMLEQKRPKADRRELAIAKKAFVKHMKECKDCDPDIDKSEFYRSIGYDK